MKKSEIYKLAELAVVSSECICSADKLEIIKELQDREDLEKFVEKQAEEKAKCEESGEQCASA